MDVKKMQAERSAGAMPLATEVDALLVYAARLEGFVEAFGAVARGAVAAHDNRESGGQKVPYLGEFTHMLPSVANDLRRWAREAVRVLDQER